MLFCPGLGPQTRGRFRDVGTENKAIVLMPAFILKHPSGFHAQSPNRTNLIGPARLWQQPVRSVVLGAGVEGWPVVVGGKVGYEVGSGIWLASQLQT